MDKLLLKKLLTSLLFVVVAVIFEIFLFLYIGLGIFPTYFLLNIGLILFIGFSIFFVKDGWLANLILFFFLSCQIILSYMNICINLMLADVFTFDMMSLVTETVDVFNIEMLPIWPVVFYLSVLAMVITAVVFLNKLKTEDKNRKKLLKLIIKNVALWGVVLATCLHSVGVLTIKGNEKDDLYLLSDRVLYNTLSSNRQSLIKFGTYGFYFEEFFRKFVKSNDVVRFTRAELDAFANSHEYDPTKSVLWNVSNGQNVIVIMAESFEWYAISEELTPTLFALANGYDFGDKNNNYKNFDFYDFDANNDGLTDIDEKGFLQLLRNDYTYDELNKTYYKNIIDSSNPDNIIYDNLFNDISLFSNYGLTLSSFFSKAKTDYSEASVLLGNYPYNESFTTHGGVLGFNSTGIYSDLDYNFTLAKMLRDSRAVDSATYLHSYLSTFYGRDSLIKKFGFDETLFLDQMTSKIDRGGSISHAALDSQVLDYYLNSNEKSLIPTDKTTLSFFTTITTHGEFDQNPLLEKHYEYMNSLYVQNYLMKQFGESMSEDAFHYLASALDTEYMMTVLVKYLMDKQMFDNTTIVFYADHQSYYSGLDLKFKKDYYTKLNSGIENYEYKTLSSDRFNVPAFIYSTSVDNNLVGTNGHNIKKFTNAFDITTTLFTMLGVKYNPSYYFGYPVKCNVDGNELGQFAILSPTGGVFNERLYTDDGKTLLFSKYPNISPEEVKTFSIKIAENIERRYKVTALYKYNMFKGFAK